MCRSLLFPICALKSSKIMTTSYFKISPYTSSNFLQNSGWLSSSAFAVRLSTLMICDIKDYSYFTFFGECYSFTSPLLFCCTPYCTNFVNFSFSFPFYIVVKKIIIVRVEFIQLLVVED